MNKWTLLTLCLIALAGCCTTSPVKESDSDLKCSISTDKSTASTNTAISFTFTVQNTGDATVDLPIPDTGTLSFNTVVTDENRDEVGAYGHTALAAELGCRYRWATLEPGKSLSYSFPFEWQTPGMRMVYFTYGSRFEDMPFETRQTPKLKITVTR